MKILPIVFGIVVMAAAPRDGAGPPRPVERFVARDRIEVADDDRRRTFGLPAAVFAGGDGFYVLDADDHEVRAFTREGVFVRSMGRRGAGPGEFDRPSGACARGDRVYVADTFRRRIVVFDGRGAPAGEIPLDFAPESVLAMDDGAFLGADLPLVRGASEKMIRSFDAAGRVSWRAFDSVATSDPVADTLRNRILVLPWPGGFAVVRRERDRLLRFFDARGTPVRTRAADPAYPRRAVSAVLMGRTVTAEPFCWAAASDGGSLFLVAPEETPDRDLGPGRVIYALDGDGRLERTIECPSPVVLLAVDRGRIFAVDRDYRLRVWTLERP